MAANNRRMSGKKGAQVGSGGQRRRGLEGKGPTPPAEARKGHKKNRIANAKAKQVQRRPVTRGRGGKGTSEMVVGRNPVVEALREGVPAVTLYVQQFIDNDERVREALQLAGERGGIHLMEAPRPELDRMTNGLNHQGMVLQVPPYEYAHPEDLANAAYDEGQDPLIVALDGVTDPRNLGAILRTAEGAGATGVLLPRRRSVHVTPAVTKAAAGAVEHLPIALVSGIPALLERARRAGVWAVGLDERGPGDVFSLELATEPVVLVLGAEGRGLSRLTRERCDVLVRIPMLGRVASLNVATAAGLAAYEVARRRRGATTEGVGPSN